MINKPYKITLCGSTKFKKEFEIINKQLSLEGNVVYSVAFFGHADNIPLTKEQKEQLDAVHKSKIDNSDAILVINVNDYIGESTRSEIEYAEKIGKTIKYLSDFPDLMYLCESYSLDNHKMINKTAVKWLVNQYIETTHITYLMVEHAMEIEQEQKLEPINKAIKLFEEAKTKAESIKDMVYLDGVLAVLDTIKNETI